MAQVLHLGRGQYVTVDRIFKDNGKDAQYALIGGSKVLIEAGQRPKPEIMQVGDGFFFKDMAPVTNHDHISHLPPKYKELAERFLAKQAEGSTPRALKPVPLEKAVEAVEKRGRGRPKKIVSTTPVIEIKDADSYRAAGGVEVN